MTRSTGFTFIELVVVLAIIALVVGANAIAPQRTNAPVNGAVEREVSALRNSALLTGMPRRGQVIVAGAVRSIFALPDGRIIADSALSVDRLTGRLP
ncbi:MAG TPA: prepilin-type N-terminal cleavage/methylation domain-containing protein [Gemmatimonadaceae bacterium]